MANISTDKAVFQVTPAPSEQNQSKEIWNTYLNDTVDELNVVNMRTNELVGTIGGGSPDYKFNKLPNSFYAKTTYDGGVLGDAISIAGNLNANIYYYRYNNDIIAVTSTFGSHFRNGILITLGENITNPEPFLVAFKVNEDDKNLLEKVAEVSILSTDLYNNGFDYTYQPIGVDNECYFIRPIYPSSDSQLLETKQTKVTITESNGTYSLNVENIIFNYGGKTVLELYNENAPSPVLSADWIYRSPVFSNEDDFRSMLNGSDEGWIWYGNYTSGEQTLFPYLAGFNIVTGETAYIEPINSLANTTNFNPIGSVDYTYFVNNWESHPAGVWFSVYNQQPLNNYNNTNSVTALYSPRWENNDKVTFLTLRDTSNGDYLCTNGGFFPLLSFDSENIVFERDYVNSGYSASLSRFKLDSDVKTQEVQVVPFYDNGGLANILFINDACIIVCKNNDVGTYGGFTYIYWQRNTSKPYLLQSNNANFIYYIANNRIHAPLRLGTPLALEFDEYKNVVL